VVDDWRLLIGLSHYIHDASRRWILAVAAGVVVYALAVALAAWTFARFQTWAESVAPRRRAVAALVFALVGGVAVASLRHPPANAIVQPLADGIVVNVRASRVALAKQRAIFDRPPDRRYDAFLSLPMARRPNVYLMFFEAYGQILATCTSKTAYRDLVGRIEAQLGARGFHARSGFSVAPIFGGRSWLSISTMQTGVRVDAQRAYQVLWETAPALPTLTRFFKAHGYYTITLQPWDRPRVGLPSHDFFGRDRFVMRSDLPYRGVPYGVAGVPDQYSLGYFSEHFLASAPQPRFVFYMATQSHYNWWPPPPMVRDWKALDAPVPVAEDVPWAPLAGVAAVTDADLARYLADVAYEWRVLAGFIEAHRDEDALFVVLGDHQPLLHCGDEADTFETPLHLIARDATLVDRFADVGLVPGLYAPPGARPPLRHEGLYSLLIAKLAECSDCYVPEGIAPSALRR
jgi:hypothetical protein